jgi:hypothetical protein
MKIGRILNSVLVENYKTQTANFIKQGFEAEIVKQYVEKFKMIKDKGFKELFSDRVDINVPKKKRGDIDAYKNFHDLEVIVDYVSGQRAVGKSVSAEELEVDGKPVYEDDNFEVYYADSPRACIKYKGKLPYSWCIARSDSSNMFFTYRFKPYEPAFYMVKDKKEFKKEFSATNIVRDIATGKFKYPYHFFVVQVSKNAKPDDNDTQQYIVTSANNDGDKQMSWNELIQIKPNLNSIKETFQPKPFTPEERKKFEAFKSGISDKEFEKLSYEQKREYLDIYPAVNRPISTNQFLNLPDDLKNLYVSFGIGLNDEQFADIKNQKDLLKRYKQISARKFDEYIKKEGWERRQLKMAYTELLMLDDADVKTYFGTLNKRDVNQFIRTYGHDKFDYLLQHASDKFTAKSFNEINLVRQAASGSEEATNKIDENVPEDFDVYIDSESFRIDAKGVNLIELTDSETERFYGYLDMRYWDSSYDYYFDGDSEGLRDTYKYYIEEFIKSGALKDEFKAHNLSYDYDTIDDLLETYKEKDDCMSVISDEYDTALSDSTQDAFDGIKDNISKIIRLKYEDEVIINLSAFLIYLKEFDGQFFTKDEEKFIDNIKNLLENILEENDEIYNTEQIYDAIYDAKYENLNVNNRRILEKISQNISSAFSDYSDENPSHDYDDDDEQPYGDVKQIEELKSEIIEFFNKTIKSLGQDPDNNVIQNEIVRIEFDKQRFNLNGKIWAHITDLRNKKGYEGYINIKDIPTYFKTYKLHEEILKIKRLF